MSSHSQYKIARKAVGSSGPTRSPEPQGYRSEDEKSYVPGRGGGLYWKAYTTMVSSLFCGMLLALGKSRLLRLLSPCVASAPSRLIRRPRHIARLFFHRTMIDSLKILPPKPLYSNYLREHGFRFVGAQHYVSYFLASVHSLVSSGSKLHNNILSQFSTISFRGDTDSRSWGLGHHLFYNSLNGKPVGTPQHIIRMVTRQQLNLTLGTLFAFLVKACLAVAVTTAYTQIFWRAVKKRSTILTTIDTIYYGPTNVWSLLSFSVWLKYPLLLLLVLTVW
jgi:hypothetical protein